MNNIEGQSECLRIHESANMSMRVDESERESIRTEAMSMRAHDYVRECVVKAYESALTVLRESG